eukprot:Rmarinus@m.22320
MACSKFEYVKKFEQDEHLLPGCYIVVRIDGRGFHRFAEKHDFQKPNDIQALTLMNKCAIEVMKETPDIMLAYGQSDEYSFVISRESILFQRRRSKIESMVVSQFSSAYVFHWASTMEGRTLQYPPGFDARAVCYPTTKTLLDYLSWRQVDCHINNLYNTTFWTMVEKGGISNRDAEEQLKGSLSVNKNEILFSDYGINYNDEPEMFKKGSVLVWEEGLKEVKRTPEGVSVRRNRRWVEVLHCDIVCIDFWVSRFPDLLQSDVPTIPPRHHSSTENKKP